MKKFFLPFFLAASLTYAGETTTVTTQTTVEETPRDIVVTDSSYVFESDVNHGGTIDKQDALDDSFEYGHRFLLSGNLYLQLGLAYSRFDFGNTGGILPVHLQKYVGVVSLEYMQGADTVALLEFRPGFYTEEHFGSASFDVPITAARFFTLQRDKLYFLIGAQADFLRGDYPVLPVVGLVWKPSPQWAVFAIPPEPRIVYSPSKCLSIYAGGELTGGSFRTDSHPELGKLSGAQVDYAEYRAGAGLTCRLSKQFDLTVGGGYAIQRQFNFNRADENYRTDPAPYARIQIQGSF
ncbi:MAG: hypothetical protein M3R59_04765 [Verrucomicrobiota bacterium]|nr:hypothetical protein [Verrucomicrobiota bacterium]